MINEINMQQTKLLIILINLFVLNLNTLKADNVAGKPNIVIIMADDMGFDDISFRGSNKFLTPNIDALAYSGVILNNLYTAAMCTPSRAALLTGKYPINTGMQHYVIVNDEPWGLPVNESTMAEIFQNNGYYTSLIGKWHLGMSRKAYTPTMRGFNHHYGYLGAYIDYYDQTFFQPNRNYSRGHDFRENLEVSRKRQGSYVTNVLTDVAVDLIASHNTSEKPLFLLLSHLAPHAGNDDAPLQAPAEEVDKFAYISNVNERTYAAMVSLLDKSVGQVIDALAQKGILDNTIILFLSDNGGPTVGQHATTASNYPLRGQKAGPWEGSIRSSAAIWSTQFEKLGAVWKQRIYIGDFLPTLASAAGIQLDAQLNLNGINLWSALKYGYDSVEREIVHNIDDQIPYVSFTKGKWKYINGTTSDGDYDTWLGLRPSADGTGNDPRAVDYENVIRNTTVWQYLQNFSTDANAANLTARRIEASINCQYAQSLNGVPCLPLLGPCFFDIDADPCEQNNLFKEYQNSSILTDLLQSIEQFRANAHKPNNKPADPKCDPRFYHDEWTWWEDADSSSAALNARKQYLLFSMILACIVLCLFRP